MSHPLCSLLVHWDPDRLRKDYTIEDFCKVNQSPIQLLMHRVCRSRLIYCIYTFKNQADESVTSSPHMNNYHPQNDETYLNPVTLFDGQQFLICT